jgi:hypothetical protein
MVLKSVACVTLVRKAVYGKRITTFFKIFGVKNINEPLVTNNKLTNNFSGLVTSSLEPDVARERPVGHADAGISVYELGRISICL